MAVKNQKQQTRTALNAIKASELSLKRDKANVKKQKDKSDFTFGKIERTTSKVTLDVIPYTKIHNENITELPNNNWSKTYSFTDVNFSSARDEEQMIIFGEYSKFINSLAHDIMVQISIISKTIPIEDVYNSVTNKNANEFEDPIFDVSLKDQFNETIINFLDQGVNNHVTKKYITVSIPAENKKTALGRFAKIEGVVKRKFKDISKDCELEEVKKEELAIILAEILRGSTVPKVIFDNSSFERSDEKGYIAPDGFQFEDTAFQMGKKVAKCIFLRDLPSHMTEDLVSSISNTNVEHVISINLKPVETAAGRNKILSKQTEYREEQLKKNKKAAKAGVFIDLTPQPVLDGMEAADEMHNLVKNQKQGLFLFSFVVMLVSNTYDELIEAEEEIRAKASALSCEFGELKYQQKRALQTVLPIGFNNLSIVRVLPTECVSIFSPFDKLTTIQPGGLFYSLHADNKQAIVLNHNSSKNFSGFIIGSSGSGKGMFFKPMVQNILHLTNDDVIIVDPENENERFVKSYGGQTIELSAMSKDHINPFDIPPEDEDLQKGIQPAQLKIDLILSIIEAMLNSEVNPGITSTIDGILTNIYKDFAKSHNPQDLPTFKEFYHELERQNTPITNELLDVMRIYVTGSWSNFSNRTNVNVKNRLICYNTNMLGERLRPVGSFMMFDAIWNRIAKNRNTGKNTWVFTDEVHLVFNSEEGIKRVDNMYRRIRKYDGKMISLTQNTSDVLKYSESRSMVSNSDFIVVMNQKETDRREVSALLNIPQGLMGHITNAGKGEGIIFNEKMLVPFASRFPRGTRLYELMTTDPKELAIILEKEKEAIKFKEIHGYKPKWESLLQ